ncbi:predicted enzyme with a TIM-barrel fold [Serpentinimonas raichei]|uniref:Pyridoxal phosphate homeostasis protein n=1 Tax=Serpentinimonas raichei TaxID=1458425 RepID=A0A060NH21_9BURK|nr:YggS family pyridoxal phosphate-dependent enzyme [Serpentinimonas raichei]BAO79945.1 predicted enzyme with a TIM-barrel fold [Serpentinimonas raichei]
MTTIDDRLRQVRARIASACARHGRDPAEVHLLAVSKTWGPDAVWQAWQAGQREFGENYVQEGVEKISALRALGASDLVWHFIGPLQSNKTRAVAEHFDWVHGIDRFKIAQRLSEQRPPGLGPLQVCIQVNLDGGANKAGVPAAEALALAQQVAALPRLQLRGLMCIPEPAPNFAAACRVFGQLAALRGQLQAPLSGLALDTLSMGMSDDLEAAIASGSTLLRVGSAIFGPRAYASGKEK